MEPVEFKSENLILQGRLSRPGVSPPYLPAVIAHPHPLFGGSMDNNVVLALRDQLLEMGYLVLRFNFRGVGKSQGGYGNLLGEAKDIISACDYLFSLSETENSRLVACGYSFGGLALLYALAKGLSPRALVLVSPMVPEGGWERAGELKKILPLKIPALILLGERDDFFTSELYQPLGIGQEAVKFHLIPDADHFFWGKERELVAPLKEFLAQL